LEDISEKLNTMYGQKLPLMIHHREGHEYLGMKINYSDAGKVKFIIEEYINAGLH
jgi:hypothetical protein